MTTYYMTGRHQQQIQSLFDRLGKIEWQYISHNQNRLKSTQVLFNEYRRRVVSYTMAHHIDLTLHFGMMPCAIMLQPSIKYQLWDFASRQQLKRGDRDIVLGLMLCIMSPHISHDDYQYLSEPMIRFWERGGSVARRFEDDTILLFSGQYALSCPVHMCVNTLVPQLNLSDVALNQLD